MISYIISSHNRSTLEENLLKTIQLKDSDETVIITDGKSIAEAYNRGIRKAKNKIKCFIHHDVQILAAERLRENLIRYCTPDRGMIGVIGSTNPDASPWWDSGDIGSAVSQGIGTIRFNQPGGECAVLDGFMLATVQDLRFDESIKGYHFYDHDICRHMLQKDLVNYCIPDGHTLMSHNSPQTYKLDVSWLACMIQYMDKWKIKYQSNIGLSNIPSCYSDAEIDLTVSKMPEHDVRTAGEIIRKEFLILRVKNLHGYYDKFHQKLVLSMDEGPIQLLRQHISRAGMNLYFVAQSGQDHIVLVKKRVSHEGVCKKTSIVMLSYGKGDYTRRAVESIHQHTARPFEIIVVDNKSPDQETLETLQVLKEQKKIHKLILNAENAGVPKGWNQGIREASGDFVCILNNDILVTSGWLSAMRNCLDNEPQAGCVGSRTNSITGPQMVFNAPGNEQVNKLLPLFSKTYCELHKNGWWETARIRGFSMLFPREILDQIGLFDEQFGQGNFEDDDMCMRLLKAGHKLFVVDDSYIHHFGSLSFQNMGEAYQELLWKNLELFLRKWKVSEPELVWKVNAALDDRVMPQYHINPESLTGTGREMDIQIKNYTFCMPQELKELYKPVSKKAEKQADRVLIVTPVMGGARIVARDVRDAFLDLRKKVHEIDCAEFITDDVLNADVETRNRAVVQINEAIVAACKAEKPELLLVLALAPVRLPYLHKCRAMGVKTALWWIEDYRLWDSWKNLAGGLDCIFTIQPGEFERILNKNQIRNYYLPTGFNEKTSFAVGHKKTEEVVFIGSPYQNRIEILEKLAKTDIPFKLWGNGWEKAEISTVLKKHLGEPVGWISPEKYSEIFRSAKIAMNLHSSPYAGQGVHTEGDFLNPWVFAIPACGALQIVDRRPLIKRFFKEGEDIICYGSAEEMQEKIKYYLANDAEREEIVKRSLRTVNQKHSYEERALQILKYIETFAEVGK